MHGGVLLQLTFMCYFLFVENVLRSKRRCVLEKKQPYSGDEWCSEPDTEDEEKPHTAMLREFIFFHKECNVSPSGAV